MNHYNLPSEIDVESQSCDYNSRTGFAGDIGDGFYSVNYYYTLLVDTSLLGNAEVLSYNTAVDFDSMQDNSIHNVIFQIELGIGSYLLRKSGEFESAPCNMRSRHLQLDSVRNVGLTIGPDDEIVATCEATDPLTACYWISGSFQVYTVGIQNEDTTVAEQNIHDDLKYAMNNGELSTVHEAIVNITYLDALPTASADRAETGQPSSKEGDTLSADTAGHGPNTAIIVSASVGALLLIAAIALVNQRRNRCDEQHFLQGSSVDASEFHMSREATVVERSDVV
ncbi:hypothetical protein IV203_001332 [Nitzschia inconspicua]|uniref:Uncharacterized protein n=1 Tax=Nitzschia inconspicua TaxID=303405 RepID=A0A9K3L8D0_9STRA|nr:hypothetical protein IV203_001332 [Nitzschia inconspicua]